MTEQERTTFSDSMTALGVIFGQAVDKTMRQAYWQFLRDLPMPDFLRAIEAAGKTLKWFPKPAELRELSGAGVAVNAAEAWEAVIGAMRKHDYTASVDFGPLVNAVVRNLGGWLWLCDRSERDLTFERKKFEELYAAHATKDPAHLNGAPLLGQFGGTPVPIAIGGALPPKQIGGNQPPFVDLVRQLADDKSVPPGERPPVRDIAQRLPEKGAA